METVPSSAVCTFVGEGAANVVFELTGVADHPNLNGQLLRLPKDESSGMSYAELQDYWENKVSPLFEPHELVQQKLVQLPQDPEFFDRLNQQLEQIEEKGTRRHDFAGHRFAPEGMKTGMLVEDMRPRRAGASPSTGDDDDGDEDDDDDLFTLHEIKPKWLHQSPRAPEGAEQCRNCAREVQRNLKNSTRNPVFCPLNLVKAVDFPRNQHVVGDIRRSLGLSEAQSDNLQAWLRGSTLLRRLRTAQWDNDHAPKAVVPVTSDDNNDGGDDDDDDDDGDDNISRYCLAMTLRDCSLFLRIPRRPGAKAEDVVAKLADMDKKNFGVKREYWEGMEQGLHAKGLYWKGDGVSAELTDCQLPFYKAGGKNLPPNVRTYYRI
ncbi:inositol pentakisphosphate 2-kinase-like protein [Diaporthe amygdali]|uniref:inositol pentakisphosphate 2-kinase-like protein n=1 Tax=Phomopsis amygdali TaxID=1214568 RepID=UPI0022FE41B0|nr:inositol pentakisphosphate 2-kinase-like protein [Diaporthe amygdali]KAJ0107574.1 inositol pentakisphosphate 2-kinase-like protein [Diaporthe amygdali]